MKRRLCAFSSPSAQIPCLPRQFSSSAVPEASNNRDQSGESTDATAPVARPLSAAQSTVAGEVANEEFVSSADGLRTIRRRRQGKEPLPIPPLLDERVDTARRRHEASRPPQDWNDLTEFQKELMGNPFAQILATPLRMDNLTRKLYPRFFLQAFGTRIHPPSEKSKTMKGKPAWNPKVRDSSTQPTASPHFHPLHPSIRPSPKEGPRTYLLSGADRLALLAKGKANMLWSPRHQEHYGLGRDKWCIDVPAVEREAETLVVKDVAGQLFALDRNGRLRVCDTDTDTRQIGVTIVVLDPARAEDIDVLTQRCRDRGCEPVYGFVVPPNAIAALSKKKAGRSVAKLRAESEPDLLHNGQARVRGNEPGASETGVLGSSPAAVVFDINPSSVGAVMSLLRMDLFYRSPDRSGRREILRMWEDRESSIES
ncbi:hypothetical protein ANO11243_012160 [Dothideomycetidae sp. 11243]|nr:hypothetical protein ANO11243_012160 [fungal sp. No.11243]